MSDNPSQQGFNGFTSEGGIPKPTENQAHLQDEVKHATLPLSTLDPRAVEQAALQAAAISQQAKALSPADLAPSLALEDGASHETKVDAENTAKSKIILGQATNEDSLAALDGTIG